MAAPLIPPMLMLLIKTAIGAKVIGFLTSFLLSPTNHAMRTAFLEHTEHVLEGLDKNEMGPSDEERKSLQEDLDVLRANVVRGWVEPMESAAVTRVCGFLSKAHIKGVGGGMADAFMAHAKAAGESIDRNVQSGIKVFEENLNAAGETVEQGWKDFEKQAAAAGDWLWSTGKSVIDKIAPKEPPAPPPPQQ